MGKLNKNELLEGVRSIIQEEFNSNEDSFDGTSMFNIHKYVNNLIEEGHKNLDLMSYLLKYDNLLSKGTKDFMIFEQFGQGLVKFAKGNKFIKDVINEMNQTLAKHGRDLVAYKLIENIQDPIIKDDINEAFNHYVYNKTEESRDDLLESLQPLMILSDPIALLLNLMLTEDSKVTANMIDTEYYNDYEAKALQEKLQEQRNQKTMKLIYNKVQQYIDNKFAENEENELLEQQTYCLESIANNNGLDLLEHIGRIRNTDAKSNEKLMEVLDVYADAIESGAYEERLYENFLYNISKFNYLLPVDKEIKSITEKVNNKHEEITLTKILEEMKDTYASSIYVDLIQEDVARYVKEPTAINRVQLRNALMPYASDPFINEMFNILYADNTRRGNELSEKVLDIKDRINLIRENASISNIYTPVQYVCENESIFNVNGLFYVKKGNNIALLEEKYVNMLNESFVELCRLVNDPHVTINDDYIVLNGNEQTAIIYEGYVDIHGQKESKESLRNLNEMCMKYDNYDTNFYIMCSCLLENFNNIAKVDWAKRVTLNENKAISADLFKLDSHIFMVTHNDSTSQHTFYRNINPIFCKNKLNEHMGINVSSLFNDLLPSQDKIVLKLNETKNSYEDSIEKYEDMIEKLKDALDNASDENKDKLKDAIKDAEEKLDDIKKEYIEWQKQVDDVTGKSDDTDDDSDDSDNDSDDNADNDSDDVFTEKPNEPIDDEEVDNVKDELSQPLQGETSDSVNTDDYEDEATGESSITDDDFAKFLGGDDDSDETDDETDTDDAADFDEDFDDDDTDESDDEFVDDDEPEANDADFFNSDDDTEDNTDDVIDDEEFTEVNLGDESDDDVFEDEPVADDTVANTEVTTDVVDEPAESVSDSDDETEEVGDAATDVFGGNVEDPLGDNETPVIVPENAPQTEESDNAEMYTPKFSYKIADVMFDENVKQNKKEKSGSVIAIIPMIDGTGKKYVENKTIQFYIDDDNNPILDNEPMTNDLYAAIIDSIKNHPDYAAVCQDAEPANEQVGATIAPLMSDDDEDEDWEAAYLRDGNDEDRGMYNTLQEDDNDDWGFDSAVNDNESESDTDNNLFGFNFDDFDDDEDEQPSSDNDSTENVIIPTYKSGNTEIEFPSPTADGTAIPESKLIKNKKALKESIKITPVFTNKNGKRFFLNEATIKASKKMDKKVTPLTEEIIDGSDTNEISSSDSTGNGPIEYYNERPKFAVLNDLYNKAVASAKAAAIDSIDVTVRPVNKIFDDLLAYFDIYTDDDAYTVYQIEDCIYFRNSDEFGSIMQDFDDEVPMLSIESLKYEYDTDKELSSYSILDNDDCLFVISSIFSALTGRPYDDINENCKIIRHTRIDSDNDINQSKKADEAKYGTEEENLFKQELEDKQKKDGTVGALDPQLENESVQKLPNVNLIEESTEYQLLLEKGLIEYEVNDKVIYKGEVWDVFSISGVIGDKQLLKITKAGTVLDVTSSDVKPDPSQLKDIDPSLTKQFDFDKNNLTKTPTNDKTEKMRDLNDPTVECNIMLDSEHVTTGTLNGDKYRASLTDILEGLDDVRVYLGDTEKVYPKQSILISEENWIPAVIATEEDDPIRKIKVNPTSYVETEDENDLVDCSIAGKITLLPKRAIRILV